MITSLKKKNLGVGLVGLKKNYFTLSFQILILWGLLLITMLWFSDPGVASAYDGEEEYLRGEVQQVEDLDTPRAGEIKQEAVVEVSSGEHKGKETSITHYYRQMDLYGVYLLEGMEVILVDMGEEFGEEVLLHDVARDRGVYILLGLFIVLLLAVGRSRGAKALLMLAFMGFFIVRVLLPLVLRGYNPIWISVITGVILVTVTLLVIVGWNQKSISAIGGTVTGLLIAGFLALWTGGMSHLTGFSSEEAQMLFYFAPDINIRDLLFAGIIIGALGAMIDVGISVSSAAAELKETKPDISIAALTTGAMNVGRDVMATMANTMILAYVGAAIPLLLFISGMDMPWIRIINMDLIATEIVRGISISVGIVVTVPVTALLAGLLMGSKEVK